jgi:glycosyltransferase involved in cell wall biosynthesis
MKRRAKIAMLGPFPPAVGGIVYSIQNLLNSPLSRRYQFECLHTYSKKGGSPEYQNEGVPLKILRLFFDFLRFPLFLMKGRPDFVHIHTSFGKWSFWRDSVYLSISNLFRKRALLQIHGGTLNEFIQRRPHLSGLAVRLLKLASIIVVLSDQQYEPFRKIGLNGKVRRIPNMIDSQRVSGIRRDRRPFRLPEKHRIVLLVAPHLFKEKGVYEFIHAADWILRRYTGVTFVVVGSGGEEENLRTFCGRKNLTAHIRFLGNLSHRDVLSLMAVSDIFVLPSWSEGFPMVVLEAMAVGLPVVSTNVGALPEIIHEGIQGYLVAPLDVKSLRHRISRLLDHPSKMRRMGRGNAAEIKERYDIHSVYRRYDKCYRELMDSRMGVQFS